MSKSIYIIFALTLIQVRCLGQYDISQIYNYQFEVKTENLKEKAEYYIDTTGKKIVTNAVYYNANGKIVDEITYEKFKVKSKHVTYEYDNDNLISKTVTKGDVKEIYQYKNNKLIKSFILDSVNTNYEYNNNNQLIKENKIVNYESGKIEFIKEFNYNGNNLIIEKYFTKNHTNEDIQFNYIRENKYDDGDNLIQYLDYNFTKEGNKKLYEIRNYKYRNNKLIKIEYQIDFIDSLPSKISYEKYYYNENGYLDSIKHQIEKGGDMIFVQKFERNDQLQLVKFSHFIDGDLEFEKKYFYDSFGSLLKVVESELYEVMVFHYYLLYW